MQDDDCRLEDEYLSCAIEQTHPFVCDYAGEALRTNLLEVVRRDVGWITSAEFAQSHSRGRAMFGMPPGAFNNRIIQIGTVRLIAGIRFRNLDNYHPFVSIEHNSLPIGTLGDITELMRTMHDEFSAFRPRALSFHHPSHLPLRIAGAKADFHVLIAPAQAMAARSGPPEGDRVALVAATELDFYDRYVALYDDIYRERPWARIELRVEDRETLADCGAQGLLFHVHVDGAWGGVVAGTHGGRAARGAVRGVQVVEIILAKSARGMGHGVAVQRRLAENVASRQPNAIIWGTVAHANVPMRRTAERAGRVEIGTTYCVDF
jgi:RimJ/RimL family protein N-acetyltransferase